MGLFARQEKWETIGKDMVGSMEAGNNNSRIAERVMKEKFDKVPMDRAIENVNRLIEHNRYNLVLRDRLIGELDKYQLIRDAAEVCAAKSAERTLIKAEGEYLHAIELNILFGKIEITLVRQLLRTKLKRLELEKASLEKLERMQKAGILHEEGSYLRYYSSAEYWDARKHALRRESDNHHFTPHDVTVRRGRDLTTVKNDIRRIGDFSANAEKPVVEAVLDMLEEEFDISIKTEMNRGKLSFSTSE
ncbi:MAG: hypothetical protein KGH65_00965 [Candidatus Micrarchaeota archaeon]|nr:hypothetical protein [Candidatus Micrarchaeota archaeon]